MRKWSIFLVSHLKCCHKLMFRCDRTPPTWCSNQPCLTSMHLTLSQSKTKLYILPNIQKVRWDFYHERFALYIQHWLFSFFFCSDFASSSLQKQHWNLEWINIQLHTCYSETWQNSANNQRIHLNLACLRLWDSLSWCKRSTTGIGPRWRIFPPFQPSLTPAKGWN